LDVDPMENGPMKNWGGGWQNVELKGNQTRTGVMGQMKKKNSGCKSWGENQTKMAEWRQGNRWKPPEWLEKNGVACWP